ncbi:MULTISPECIES: abortive infection family protein [Cupriavidus]
MESVEEMLEDAGSRGKLLLALKRAIEAEFTEADWTEFAFEHEPQFLQHPRLLRGCKYRNEDYGDVILTLLRGMWQRDQVEALKALAGHRKVQDHMADYAPDVLAALRGMIHVPAPVPGPSASELVQRALADAETLIRSPSGPVSAVDRVHTAVHGYFKDLCQRADIDAGASATLTQLFKHLRHAHPAFVVEGPHAEDVRKIALSMAAALDAVNTLRNHASVAHPNEVLLGPVEAMLAVNAARTLFNYVAEKVG